MRSTPSVGASIVQQVLVENKACQEDAAKAVRCTWRDEFVVIVPGLLRLIFVSSQAGFSEHLRYVLPASLLHSYGRARLQVGWAEQLAGRAPALPIAQGHQFQE